MDEMHEDYPKFTVQEIADIREKAQRGISKNSLAVEYRTTFFTVKKIVEKG